MDVGIWVLSTKTVNIPQQKGIALHLLYYNNLGTAMGQWGHLVNVMQHEGGMEIRPCIHRIVFGIQVIRKIYSVPLRFYF